MKLDSNYFQTIADLLALIEISGIPSDQYGILDGGRTLETSKDCYDKIKGTSQFQAFEQIGGQQYCYETIAQTSHLAAIFEVS